MAIGTGLSVSYGGGPDPDEFSGLDFAAGVLTGARSFRIDKLGRLTGVNVPQVWTPGENTASCRKNDLNGGVIISYTASFNATYSSFMRQYLYGNTAPKGYHYETVTTTPEPTRLQRLLRLKPIPVETTVEVKDPEPEPAPKPKAAPKPKPKPDTMDTCAHGFYAYYDGSNDYHKDGMVSAVVEGYGECVVGTRGFRAMKARIVALQIPGKVSVAKAQLIARNYPDVPIYESFRDMIAAHPTDAGIPQVTPENTEDFWTREA